jgi:hypothetical protein
MRFSVGSSRRLNGCLIAAITLVAGCAHGEALDFRNQPESGPFDPGPPVVLTLNLLEDQYPSWLPDGSGILYSYIPDPTGSRDRCLGLLPAGGGQITETMCYRRDNADDSTDVIVQATARTSHEIAWLEQHNLRSRRVPDYGGIVIGTLVDGAPTTRVVSLPYVAASGSIHATVTDLRWLSAQQLAYIGNDIIVRAPCIGCRPDTVVVAKEVMLVNRQGGPPQILSGSEQTTSIWPTADSTGLYYTLGGDSRVYRRSLAGGAPAVIHDFGSAGIARDISVVGNRLAAIVGGNVSYGSEPLIPLRQIDSGGTLVTVDLDSGAEQVRSILGTCFRRAVLSPTAATVVVEAVDERSPNPDLLLFTVP